MELTVSTLNWLGRAKKPLPAQTIKFNRYNLIFNSRQKLRPGQLIFVNLSAGHHALREVSARVEECEKCGQHYQSQVHFVLQRPDKKPYREAISVLKAIEQAVPHSLLAPIHN